MGVRASLSPVQKNAARAVARDQLSSIYLVCVQSVLNGWRARVFVCLTAKPDTGTYSCFQLDVDGCNSPNTEPIPVKQSMPCAAEHGLSSQLMCFGPRLDKQCLKVSQNLSKAQHARY